MKSKSQKRSPALPQKSFLIHTGLQPGVSRREVIETVSTVSLWMDLLRFVKQHSFAPASTDEIADECSCSGACNGECCGSDVIDLFETAIVACVGNTSGCRTCTGAHGGANQRRFLCRRLLHHFVNGRHLFAFDINC